MLANLFSWWLARISELLPTAWTNFASRLRDGLVVDVDADQNVVISARRDGRLSPLTLGAAARQAGRSTLFIRPPAQAILVKNHTVPAAPRRQLDQLLQHELARITPFTAETLFWRWDSRAKPANGNRIDVTLTMVPRLAVAGAFATLEDAGLQPDFIEVETGDRPRLLSIKTMDNRSGGTLVVRVLAGLAACLAGAAVVLPFVLQAVALHTTNVAIEELQPTIAKINELHRVSAAGDAGREVLVSESERTGDVLQTLALITRLLPDDTYLTDFSLRERQMTLSGRSASAPRLITLLSGDPGIKNTAFAAPVTRIEGATTDVFSIKAEVGK